MRCEQYHLVNSKAVGGRLLLWPPSPPHLRRRRREIVLWLRWGRADGQRWFTRSGDPISAFLSSSSSSSSFQRVFVAPCLGGPRQKEEETSIHIGTAEAKGGEREECDIWKQRERGRFFLTQKLGKTVFRGRGIRSHT